MNWEVIGKSGLDLRQVLLALGHQMKHVYTTMKMHEHTLI